MLLPKINYPRTQADKFLDTVSIVLLLGTWAVILKDYTDLPDLIPLTYNRTGEASALGPRWILFVVPAITTFIYGGLSILMRFPQKFRYPAAITEENRDYQYMMAMRMIRGLRLSVTLVFSYVSFQLLHAIARNKIQFGRWFVPISLMFILLPVLLYFVKMGTSKRS